MTDTAETMKSAAQKTVQAQSEKVQAAGTQAFREGLDKTTASMNEIGAQSKQNLDAMTASAAAAQKGAEALSQQALDYSKASWEQGVAAAQSMAQARSIQELVELQTNFAKSAMEAYVSHVSKATETLTASVKDSFKPVNERMTASVEKIQAVR